MQTQTSNTLHNAIMEAGSKDHPPMLALNPPYELGWKDKRVPDADGNLTTTTERVFETYKNVKQDIRDQLNAEAEAVQIILTGIDNDIYSTVDVCPNAYEMWKTIERLKQGLREIDLYSITLQNINSPNPICLVAKVTSSQAWLWHRRLSHLNFDTINLLSNNDIVVGLPKELPKEPYHIINDRKPSVKFFHIFGSVCYIIRDEENLDKMKEKGDECIFVGYSNQSRAYRVFNKRTRVTMESIHVNFDELPLMASDQNSSDPAPECQTTALNHDSLSPAIQRQANVTQADRTLVEIVLFIVDSGCSKYMTRNLKLLINFVEKFLGTIKFGNDQIAPILGYGDLVQGAVTIKRVYYVEGLNHNLFSVGQFCDADLEVAFRKSTCFIRDLKGNDLL
nr:Gag-Pol polyprotein [Tanacetum cinerariifolium]